jgi:triphosphoribosyl-dephospho-CoA synthase
VGLKAVLCSLDEADSVAVYQAIRLAAPGGLGRVAEQDVCDEPTLGLRQLMGLAADRDLIARQYDNWFDQVVNEGVPALRRGLEVAGDLERAIIYCHLHLMAAHPDSLIQRKCGRAEAEEAARRAQAVLAAGWPREGWNELIALDAWLRADGHRRNPGTTADLVTACLFVALRQGIINPRTTFAAARK